MSGATVAARGSTGLLEISCSSAEIDTEPSVLRFIERRRSVGCGFSTRGAGSASLDTAAFGRLDAFAVTIGAGRLLGAGCFVLPVCVLVDATAGAGLTGSALGGVCDCALVFAVLTAPLVALLAVAADGAVCVVAPGVPAVAGWAAAPGAGAGG